MNLLPQILPKLLVRARKLCLGNASMERCSSPPKRRNPGREMTGKQEKSRNRLLLLSKIMFSWS